MSSKRGRFTIEVQSVNRHKEVEWTDTIEAGSRAAAARKAYRLIRSSGVDEPAKRTRVLNDFERWEI